MGLIIIKYYSIIRLCLLKKIKLEVLDQSETLSSFTVIFAKRIKGVSAPKFVMNKK